MTEFPETHRRGNVSVENEQIIKEFDLQDCDFGVQISKGGKVWICVNGIAWIRFVPIRQKDMPRPIKRDDVKMVKEFFDKEGGR